MLRTQHRSKLWLGKVRLFSDHLKTSFTWLDNLPDPALSGLAANYVLFVPREGGRAQYGAQKAKGRRAIACVRPMDPVLRERVGLSLIIFTAVCCMFATGHSRHTRAAWEDPMSDQKHYDDPGRFTDRELLDQARHELSWVTSLLEKSRGRRNDLINEPAKEGPNA
jgi:hypothetical protein